MASKDILNLGEEVDLTRKKNKFENLNSDFFIQKIMNNLDQKKILEISNIINIFKKD